MNMKRLSAFALCGTLALSSLGLAGCGDSASSSSSEASESEASSSSSSQTAAEKVIGANEAQARQTQFDDIALGSSYQTVADQLGGEGRQVGESSQEGKTTYDWSLSGAESCTVAFVDDAAVSKTRAGSLSTSAGVADEKAFNTLHQGMTYDQVSSAFGGDGLLMQESKMDDVESRTYVWTGQDPATNATVTFVGGVAQTLDMSALQ